MLFYSHQWGNTHFLRGSDFNHSEQTCSLNSEEFQNINTYFNSKNTTTVITNKHKSESIQQTTFTTPTSSPLSKFEKDWRKMKLLR